MTETRTLSGRSRILMVAPQPFFRPRGTPFSVLHRIRALCEAGNTVDLVTYPFGEDVHIAGLTIHRSACPPGIKDVKIGPSAAKLLLDVPLYTLTRRLLANKNYDVIHSHEEAAFFCMGLARRHGLPHIYDMHSSLPQQLRTFKSFDLPPIRGLFKKLEDRVLDSADGVITICDDLAAVALERVGDRPHAMIENTGDDTRIFGRSAEDPRADFGLLGKQILLYTGTFEAYQGLDLLLEAMARLKDRMPDAHLLMVGGRPVQVEDHKARAAALGLAERVSFTGMIDPLRIPAFLDAADVIVSPRSRGTNTPLKIYGYMRAGRPLVATKLHTHTQTLTETMACLVPPDPDGIAAGIERVLQDPDYADGLVRSAQTTAEAHYSDEAYVVRVNDLFDAVMSNSREPGALASYAC